MITVLITWPDPPSCGECGQRVRTLYFGVPLPPTSRRDAGRRWRANVAHPCGCVLNVEDVTNGEPAAPTRQRLNRQRERIPGGRRG